ncbi:MAG: insulinase family protein [Chitinophagaceae bacterium]|nr:insulinase family protein [Chitinophagaceae bacterium]
MIQFSKFTLANGLRVIVHEDHTTPMVAFNILYDVGARDEDPNQTGFAHLFEHLMFGGSVNIPDYDEPLQMAGGENNAYTTNDITNYYIQLPAENIETAFWLESDRLLSLAFSPKSLEVQRKVVCEEFKEHYINKPYGDTWKYLRELCYTQHPYRWMTIGRELAHIEQAKLEDVKAFFFKHYRPCNAILCVAGPVNTEQIKVLCAKWFAPIEQGTPYQRHIPFEPAQEQPRRLTVHKDVPVSVIFKAWHMAPRLHADYYKADLITEVLSGGQSSRLYQRLVKEKKLFSSIDCYHTGSVEQGLLVVEGKLLPHVTPEAAEAAIDEELNSIRRELVSETELEKVKNKIESMIAFEDLGLLSRANNLAFYELLGDAELMNTEFDRYRAVNAGDILEYAQRGLHPDKSNTLFYLASNLAGSEA